MLGEIQIVQSSEFLEFFKLFREANINNWDNANCILALVHWITLKKDYLLFIPGRKSASTEYLDYFSKRIRTNRDGSRVGFFTYIHKHTGLKKILEFHEANTTRNKLISFVWQDNMREQDRGIFYDRNIPIHLFIRDLNGETPKEVYDIHRIWMLTTMINVGLVSERHLKKAYIMTAKDAAQCENQKTYLSQLLQSDSSDYSDPTDREYLDTWWALDGNSSLAFIAFHIHKVVINFDSMFNLSLHEEGSKKPRCYVESNGKRILEAFYLNASSLKLTTLRILEGGNHGTEDAVTIDFGGQTMKLYEREYVRNGEIELGENLWKLTTKISVNLLTKLTMDKFKELLNFHYSGETLEKKTFAEDLLIQLKATLEIRMPLISWHDQLLQIDSAQEFKEYTLYKIFYADCIIGENGLEVYEQLRIAWSTDILEAIHLIAVFIHLALKTHPLNLQLATTIGADNIERINARSFSDDGQRFLETEYQISRSGLTKKFRLAEYTENRIIFASLGGEWVLFDVPDLVIGGEWIRHRANVWNRLALDIEVKKLLSQLDVPDNPEE